MLVPGDLKKNPKLDKLEDISEFMKSLFDLMEDELRKPHSDRAELSDETAGVLEKHVSRLKGNGISTVEDFSVPYDANNNWNAERIFDRAQEYLEREGYSALKTRDSDGRFSAMHDGRKIIAHLRVAVCDDIPGNLRTKVVAKYK